MDYLLIVLLVILLLAIYRFDGNRITTPAALSVVVFLVSSCVFSINSQKWETELQFETVLIIVSALIVFWIGTRTRVKFTIRTGINYDSKEHELEHNYYNIRKGFVFIFFLIGLVVDYLIYRRSMQILANYSASQYLLGTLRSALANDESWGTGISIMREGYYAIGYSCLFAYCVNIAESPKTTWKKWLYLLLPVIPMLIAMFFSTGRTGFIRVFGVAFITLITIINYSRKIRLSKFARNGLIVFGLLLFLFFQLGKATGKSQVFSAFDTLSIYMGSSIGAFDGYLRNPTSFSSSFAGETLYGFRGIARIFNSNVVSTPVALPFHFVAHGYNTNVYTALRRYINDFGIVGMYIIMYLKGVIFGNWERSLHKSGSKGLSLLLYAYFMYDIIMQSIEENFLREMMTLAQLFILVVFFVMYKLFFGTIKGIK